MTRISLSTLGWVAEAPAGNRLRWSFVDDPTGRGAGVDKAIVQRVALDWKLPDGKEILPPLAPPAWWRRHDDVTLDGPLAIHVLPEPAQAVCFVFRGEPCRVRVTGRGHVVADQLVNDGDVVVVEGDWLDRIVLLGTRGVVEALATLDLWQPRSVWDSHVETVGEIAVAPTLDAPFDVVLKRHPAERFQRLVATADEWTKLVECARADSYPEMPPGFESPSPRQLLQLIMATRWHVALLLGHGTCDGPGRSESPLDQFHAPPAAAPGQSDARPYAYRVLAGDWISNTRACLPIMAPPPEKPSELAVTRAALRVVTREEDDVLEAHIRLRWAATRQANLVEVVQWVENAEGEERRESVEVPAHAGTGEGLARSIVVDSHRAKLWVQLRNRDGWDRVSTTSDRLGPIEPTIDHAAPPPALAEARIAPEGNAVEIVPHPGWTPDALTVSASGVAGVYRRVGSPAEEGTREPLHASVPVSADPETMTTTLDRAVDAALYAGGSFVAAGFRATIEAIVGVRVTLRMPAGGGARRLFGAGPVRLYQDPAHPALWERVAEFSASDLPKVLRFGDRALDGQASALELLMYCVRIEVLGRLGPPSNTVFLLRQHALDAPPRPPRFSPTLVGRDGYDRTLVSLVFEEPLVPGHYQVAWMDHTLDTPAGTWLEGEQCAAFASEAVAGAWSPLVVADAAIELSDLLPLPAPARHGRRIALGIVRIDELGARSEPRAVILGIAPEPSLADILLNPHHHVPVRRVP
ncbi:hypothetical protein [Sorangium sp. So ce1099]|uniref:hypothetical protein n=1 Tax=Sorangium sp. So ce1099 TaxID=3133331 RepID=UPI003F6440FA